MRLLLIRHGQTPANVDGVLDAAVPGPGLTDLGQQQAAALPDALADRGIERLFVSTLVRTQQTAAPLAAALGTEPVVLPGLREIEAGDTQGKRDRVSVQLYISTVHGWSAGDRASRMPGGESGEEFFARYEGAIRQVEATGVAVAAVVSHGAAIRTWASAVAQNTPDEFGTKRNLENTGIVELEGSTADGWRLVDWEGEPVGGDELVDRTAQDPTGERF
ncbi:histidine phosphatase family protein [Curtobacterium sp. Csp1]|uniref:histidine phosphatase family protein n=1 Tax=unclassified Curtobacterium TaxID=257496 RepID=UPI001598522C|nr:MULTISPECIES: histidine phosphatase family protein [unclassified Curtobacterium]QKS13617.1 histidine phosphatase family protein [Curtobacterium sp. csp3]QKS20658.1 histidine phosphatase family protein [Curtobacterium sp. Csp1]